MKIYKVEIDENDTERWFNENGQLHQEGDQPAMIRGDGSQWWYKDEKQVSEDDAKKLSNPSHTCENKVV